MDEEYLDSEMFGYYNILAHSCTENEWKGSNGKNFDEIMRCLDDN